MTRSVVARVFRAAPALFRGKEVPTAVFIASAPLFSVDPQSPSPILSAQPLRQSFYLHLIARCTISWGYDQLCFADLSPYRRL